MNVTDTMRAKWLELFKELRAEGYDPYNSVGWLRIGKISLSWAKR